MLYVGLMEQDFLNKFMGCNHKMLRAPQTQDPLSKALSCMTKILRKDKKRGLTKESESHGAHLTEFLKQFKAHPLVMKSDRL